MYIAYKLNNYSLCILYKIFASNSRTRMLSDAAPRTFNGKRSRNWIKEIIRERNAKEQNVFLRSKNKSIKTGGRAILQLRFFPEGNATHVQHSVFDFFIES